ncbi:MAG TPA: AAA family ATPase, partial [Phycisphaerae bacterium]|nr:AAA family ATPase [Phycisphaerae bacterium]
MSTTIAISGKGGSGKTTVAALIVRRLVEQTGRPVLAVDADPNACLGLALGVEPETTVADIRDAVLNRELDGANANREVAFEYAVHRAVAEA